MDEQKKIFKHYQNPYKNDPFCGTLQSIFCIPFQSIEVSIFEYSLFVSHVLNIVTKTWHNITIDKSIIGWSCNDIFSDEFEFQNS